jgi:omega-amidase
MTSDMTSDLKLTLVQTSLHWHNPEANRQMLAQKLSALSEPTDLIVLPEMFTTGFSMEAPALAETMSGPTLRWLAEQAQLHRAVITGSLIIKEADKYYNRLIWMLPNGTFRFYDKRHLFRMAGETIIYTAGNSKSTFSLKGWQVCPLVCYDLRFPVWSRNKQNQYDLLLYVANWPEKRRLAWQTLLQARAIENLAYVAGVNRVGEDGNGITYAGDSVVHQPNGEVLWQKSYAEDIQTLTLSKKHLNHYRETFPAYLDADDFTLV